MIAYIKTQGSRIVKEGRHLQVKKGDGIYNTLFTYKLDQLLLFGNIEITHAARCQLLRNNIDIVFLTRYGRYLGRIAPVESKNVFLHKRQYHLLDDHEFVLRLARSIVAGKLSNMATLLMRIKRSRKIPEIGNDASQTLNLMQILAQSCHFVIDVTKEMDDVLSSIVISGTSGSFHRNMRSYGMRPQFLYKAKELGFIKVGFSKPGEPLFFDKFLSWISAHKNGDMSWLERNIDLRKNPTKLFKDCKTIISLAYPYPYQKPETLDGFNVSRYCQPLKVDYHYRLKGLIMELMNIIREAYPGSESRSCIDSSPILERSFAYSSGFGFFGKNNMLIIPGYGSFFYLAEILTTAPIETPNTKPLDCQCQKCSLCIDACPSGALNKPFSIDASRCLSYLTIESKGTVSSKTNKMMGDCFFGCDRCQEVCPYNLDVTSMDNSLPSTDAFLFMREEEFKKKFGKTPFARAGLEKIKTNILAVKANRANNLLS